MGNTFRLVRGNTRTISLPKYASDTVEIGDLLYWDAGNGAVRPASNVEGLDYATKKGNFADAFVGVALTALGAGENGDISVATSGDFIFTAPTGVGTEIEPLGYVAVGDGTAVADQTVNATATAAEAIGRALAVKGTADATVLIRLLSKANLG